MQKDFKFFKCYEIYLNKNIPNVFYILIIWEAR